MKSWWDLGEWSGYDGAKLALRNITCAFCGERGNFATEFQASKAKPNDRKVLFFTTLKCGNCAGYVMVLWSPESGGSAIHDFRVLPWPRRVEKAPEVWPTDVGRFWIQAHRTLQDENWDAAAVMARSALQLALRERGASGNNLKQEIDDLAGKGLVPRVMQEWSHELRELGNESAHPKPGQQPTVARDAKDIVQFMDYLLEYLYSMPHRIQASPNRRSSVQPNNCFTQTPLRGSA